MSVNLRSSRNKGVLIALVAGTIAVLAVGISWLQGQGTTLIEEFAFATLVLVVALYLYDKLLVL